MDRLTQFQNALAVGDVPLLGELRAAPVLNDSGRPLVVAGNNALVARLARESGGDVAVRIVASARKRTEWGVRYQAIGEFQREHRTTRLPAGIRPVSPDRVALDASESGLSNSHAVVMEWISGPPLARAVERAVAGRNSSVLRALASSFIQLWNDLQQLRLIHGDLNAHNILIRPSGQLACIDLDGMTWPTAPLGPGGQGAAAYRPPFVVREAGLRDAFAALVLITSLQALADDPELRRVHGDDLNDVDAGILFTAWDLAQPEASTAFRDARDRTSPETQALVDALEEAILDGPTAIASMVREVPGLSFDLPVEDVADASTSTWDVAPVVARMRAHYADTWTTPSISSEPVAPTPGFPDGAAVDTFVDPVARQAAVPPPVRQGELIRELDDAMARNDEAAVARIWDQVGNDHFVHLLAGEVAPLLTSVYSRRVLAETRRQKDPAVIAAAEEAAGRGIVLSTSARSAVRAAGEREQVRHKLERALAANDARQLAELAVSGELVVLGDADRESLRSVLQAIEWPSLRRALEADDDGLILAAYDDELFERSILLTEVTLERIELARRRVTWLSSMRTSLKKRDVDELRNLLIDPPEGAIERLSAPERRRVRRSIESSHALLELREALAEGPDQSVVAALNKVERVGARIPDRTTWNRIQAVVEKLAIIDDVLEASEAQPMDHARLAQLLPTVKALGLENDERLAENGLIARLERQVIRMAHVRRIRAAISRDNDVAIVTAAVPDPYDALELLEEPERDRVATAIRAKRSFARSRAE